MKNSKEDKKWEVYVHIAPNGKMYVGITSQDLNKRWKNGHGYHHNQHFSNAIKKYGWGNFQHLILKSNLTKDEAGAMEIDLIKRWNLQDPRFGYNKSPGGELGNGITSPVCQFTLDGDYIAEFSSITEATRAVGRQGSDIGAISFACRGQIYSAFGYCWFFKKDCDDLKAIKEKCQKMMAQKYKNIHKHRDAICKQVYQLDDNYNIISEFKSEKEASEFLGLNNSKQITKACLEHYHCRGYYWMLKDDYAYIQENHLDFPKRKPNGYPVLQYDLQGNFIQEFDNCQSVANYIGCSPEDIRKNCNGVTKKSHGYIWKYKDPSHSEDTKNRVVNQFDLKGKYLASYTNSRLAEDTIGINYRGIGQCCNKRIKTCGGFIWRFDDECIHEKDGTILIQK